MNPDLLRERKKRVRNDAVARGQCRQCWKPRGSDGTPHHCRGCAEKARLRMANRGATRLNSGLCEECGLPKTGKNRRYCHLCAWLRAYRLRLRRAA